MIPSGARVWIAMGHTDTVAAIEGAIPQLDGARDIADAFHVMPRKNAVWQVIACRRLSEETAMDTYVSASPLSIQRPGQSRVLQRVHQELSLMP